MKMERVYFVEPQGGSIGFLIPTARFLGLVGVHDIETKSAF